ncbi:hypothetical protein PDK26_05280 [Bacillus cereus]|nr:hypothetical protein [Bacillus cereus]
MLLQKWLNTVIATFVPLPITAYYLYRLCIDNKCYCYAVYTSLA